jgi:hypothetical protein
MHFAIGRKRLPDELKIRAIRIRGVDEIDAEVGQPAERLQNLIAIGGRTPNPLAHNAHRPETKAIDVKGRQCESGRIQRR